MVRALIPGQRTRALTALIACALLLSLAFATPVAAAGPLKLTAGSGDPDSAVAGSTFTFATTYVSKDDEPPAYVRVIVDGRPHEMAPNNASDSDMRDGARYQVRFKIKAPGTYTYSFVAQDSKGRQATLAGGSVTVKPKPKPKPTTASGPSAKPAPVSKPTPASTAAAASDDDSTPQATDDGVQGGPAALAGLLLDYDGGPGSDGYGGGGGVAFGAEALGPPAMGALPGGTDGLPGQPDPGLAPGPGVPTGAATSAIAALSATLPGFGSDQWLIVAARSAVIATGSAAMVAMALFAFKRRRREDEDPYDVPTRDEEPADSPTARTTTFEAPLTGEMAMPRWRRPSLAEARKADPGTSLAAIEAERLTFAHGPLASDPAHERRRIRYRMVRLSDSPDEILGQEIGRLDQGDEVELLERSGLYWKVRTPLGEIGWVHKMTLGDVVTAADPSAATDEAAADIDVLAAFNEAQARRGFQPQAEPVLGEGLAARFIREHGVN